MRVSKCGWLLLLFTTLLLHILIHRRDLIMTIKETHADSYSNVDKTTQNGDPEILTPITFRILTQNIDMCKTSQPLLIILVPDKPSGFELRQTIRKTYGSVSQDKLNKVGKWQIKQTIRLVFLLGQSVEQFINEKIREESELYKDIVQFDFMDSYYNLTLKVLHGFRWTVEYCNTSRYVLKADSDTFVNPGALLEKLLNISVPPEGAVFGHRYSCPCVFREGKWAVSRDVYGLDKFPDYVAGSGYVVTTNLLPGILETAQRMVYMPAIEDAFITGLIRSKLRGGIFDLPGMSSSEEKKVSHCEFVNGSYVAKTNLELLHFEAIWETLQSYYTICKA